MFFAPLLNWRHVKVTEQRTKADWAICIDELVHQHFPNAERCILVEDNLNTHTPAALYETFEPAKSPQYLGPIGASLHTQAWQLAQYG